MTERRIHWGILGTANIGRVAVVPAIRGSVNGELRAVASREEERALRFARELDVPTHHGSYEALLDSEDIDAVYIPLPNSLHREWTVKAARAGKHVLCEKPLALDASECLEMEAAAREHGVQLMEAFMYRFHPRTERVLALVRDGAVGPLRSVRAAFSFRLGRSDDIRLRPELGGGALMDVGCYCVNVARTLAGAEPAEAQAFAEWAETGVDARMSGTLRFEDGLLAQLDCGLTLARRETYEAAGPEGCLSVSSAFLPGTGSTTIERRRVRGEVELLEVPGADEYRLMVEHFAATILEERTPRYTAAEAARNMRVIESLYRSARNGGRPEPVR